MTCTACGEQITVPAPVSLAGMDAHAAVCSLAQLKRRQRRDELMRLCIP